MLWVITESREVAVCLPRCLSAAAVSSSARFPSWLGAARAPTLLLGTHLPSHPAASRCVPSMGSCGGDQSGLPLRTACQSVAPSFPDEHPPPAGSDEALPPALRRGSALARPGARVPPRLRARVAWCLLPRYRRAQRRASRWCCAEENCLDLEQTGCFEQHKGSQSEKRR